MTQMKPVGYRYRWFDGHPSTVTTGQWYSWQLCEEEKYNEICGYISNGYLYQSEKLYTIPDTHRVVSVETLRALQSVIFEAADEIQEWAHYAPEMFQTKHNLKGSVGIYRQAAQSMSAIIDNKEPT